MTLFLGLATQAAAGDISVDVTNLRSTQGDIRVAICPRDTFTKPTCAHRGSAPASAGRVVVRGVPAGTYAVQAFHDENGDGDLNRRGFRVSEGLAFSNDARIRFGPPRFGDAAIEVTGDAALTLNMRYYE